MGCLSLHLSERNLAPFVTQESQIAEFARSRGDRRVIDRRRKSRLGHGTSRAAAAAKSFTGRSTPAGSKIIMQLHHPPSGAPAGKPRRSCAEAGQGRIVAEFRPKKPPGSPLTTTLLERTTSTPSDGLGSGGTPPADTSQPATGDRLYRVVWRWHFYAGMIVAPALIVVAATGALYIFKDELEAVLYPGVTYVEPAAHRVSYEQQLAAARAAVPTTSPDWSGSGFRQPQACDRHCDGRREVSKSVTSIPIGAVTSAPSNRGTSSRSC